MEVIKEQHFKPTDIFDWIEYFPFPKPRDFQVTAINFIIDSINAGKEYIVIDAGTGTGKSVIAYTLANYFRATEKSKSWFLTTQKILQEQYINDFGGYEDSKMKTIKASSGYECENSPDGDNCFTCKKKKAYAKQEWMSACEGSCVYRRAKMSFLEGSLALTNYKYALTESKYVGEIKERDFIFCDEAHNIESEISSFTDFEITKKLTEKLGIELPVFHVVSDVSDWIIKQLTFRVNQMYKRYEQRYQETPTKEDVEEYDYWNGQNSKLKAFAQLYEQEPANWVFNTFTMGGNVAEYINLKPVDVSKFSDILFKLGVVKVLMSATLINIDTFCASLGISMDKVASMTIESPFPIENRPIFYIPVGSLSKDNIDRTLPKVANMVEEIMKAHPNEKGIIHTHSFKILNFLRDNVKDPKSRLYFQNDVNREEILILHSKSTQPTILVSPSMAEGVDLKGDLSRFQIIVKLPFPFLGDKLVIARKDKWNWWYAFQTIKTLIQMLGRSIRSEDDKAVTYILDESFNRFYKINKKLFPANFDKLFLK